VGTVDRISPADAVELAADVGPAPRTVGAVLMLDGPDPAVLVDLLAARFDAVPRFRQRLRRPPIGFGRPYWEPWPGSTADRVEVRAVGADDDDASLVAAGVRELGRPLGDGPQWRAVVLTHQGRTAAVVLAMHHVVADGIGGLAVLAGLADPPEAGHGRTGGTGAGHRQHGAGAGAGAEAGAGAGAEAEAGAEAGAGAGRGGDGVGQGGEGVGQGGSGSGAADRAVPTAPSRWTLLRDAWSEWWLAARRMPATLRRARAGRAELEHGPRGAPRCSLNAPCGPHRAAHLAEVDLAALRTGARTAGASINDALLVAAAAAMGDALRRRGEHPDALVISVPISARPAAGGADLGNAVGVMPVRVPLAGDLAARLAQVATSTRARKSRSRGASLALLAPAFRLLAALGLFRWFVERQRLVNAFLTNLRGPEGLVLGGHRVRRIAPIGVVAGNVAVAFAALSYAGRLTVTVVTDPEVVPEGGEIAAALDAALGELAALGAEPGAP